MSDKTQGPAPFVPAELEQARLRLGQKDRDLFLAEAALAERTRERDQYIEFEMSVAERRGQLFCQSVWDDLADIRARAEED